MTSVVATQKVFSHDFTLVAGTSSISTDSLALVGAICNGSSRFLSILRVSAGGSSPAIPRVFYNATTGAGTPADLVIESESTQDESVYRVFWVNDYEPSPLYIQDPANQGAGVQYAP